MEKPFIDMKHKFLRFFSHTKESTTTCYSQQIFKENKYEINQLFLFLQWIKARSQWPAVLIGTEGLCLLQQEHIGIIETYIR